MPILGSFGAAASKGLGQTRGSGVPYNVQYLIVGGGGGSNSGYGGGGGGGGGFRTIASKTFEVTTGKNYAVVVGTGGPQADSAGVGNGVNSSFEGNDATITSAGGGAGGYNINPGYGPNNNQGIDGGSGGGGAQPWQSLGAAPGGAGNVPPVSPSQGNPGGGSLSQGIPNGGAGGGGGGANAAGGNSGGPGGAGTASNITGSSVTYAGGGGGAQMGPNGPSSGSGGAGGGGSGGGGWTASGNKGTDGLGGGAGGSIQGTQGGGNGIVIIRRLTADSETDSGSVTTSGSDTIHTFNATGTYVG